MGSLRSCGLLLRETRRGRCRRVRFEDRLPTRGGPGQCGPRIADDRLLPTRRQPSPPGPSKDAAAGANDALVSAAAALAPAQLSAGDGAVRVHLGHVDHQTPHRQSDGNRRDRVLFSLRSHGQVPPKAGSGRMDGGGEVIAAGGVAPSCGHSLAAYRERFPNPWDFAWA